VNEKEKVERTGDCSFKF